MITKSWKVEQLVVKTTEQYTNLVTSVAWVIDGVLTTDSGEIYNTTYRSSTGLSEPSGEFSSFEALTQEQVIQWVQDALGVDAVALAESQIDLQFDVLVNSLPPVPTEDEVISLPWVN